jgi:hypothetical protein
MLNSPGAEAAPGFRLPWGRPTSDNWYQLSEVGLAKALRTPFGTAWCTKTARASLPSPPFFVVGASNAVAEGRGVVRPPLWVDGSSSVYFRVRASTSIGRLTLTGWRRKPALIV